MRTTRHHSIKGDQPGKALTLLMSFRRPLIGHATPPLFLCPCRVGGDAHGGHQEADSSHYGKSDAIVHIGTCLVQLCSAEVGPAVYCSWNANMPELTIGFEKGRPAYQLTSIECVLTTSACNCLEAGQGCISAGTCVIFASLMFAENRYPVLSYPILSLASHLWESLCCCPTWQQSNSTSSRVKICCKTMFDNLLPESDVEQPLA